MSKVHILGSINFDLVIHADCMPSQGETVSGHGFLSNSGGKGANQATAVAKLGGDARLIGAIGKDFFGEQSLNLLKEVGVDCLGVEQVDVNTGTAVIFISNGDNRIIIDHGANFAIEPNRVKQILKQNVQQGDVFVTQMEVPVDCIEQSLQLAKQQGAITVLNPAPAKDVTDTMLKYCDVVIPNESEAELICGLPAEGLENLKAIERYFQSKGVKNVIVTLGAKGCYFNGAIYPIPRKVDVVDTTAAGDTFVGALCTRLAQGKTIEESLTFCQTASAITITRNGAQIDIPWLEEIEKSA